jgi:hypothetical protein
MASVSGFPPNTADFASLNRLAFYWFFVNAGLSHKEFIVINPMQGVMDVVITRGLLFQKGEIE